MRIVARYEAASVLQVAVVSRIYFILSLCLACEMDSRSLEVVKWELEPGTSIEVVVRSARIIVRLSHSFASLRQVFFSLERQSRPR
jgi:hypothetical protein